MQFMNVRRNTDNILLPYLGKISESAQVLLCQEKPTHKGYIKINCLLLEHSTPLLEASHHHHASVCCVVTKEWMRSYTKLHSSTSWLLLGFTYLYTSIKSQGAILSLSFRSHHSLSFKSLSLKLIPGGEQI